MVSISCLFFLLLLIGVLIAHKAEIRVCSLNVWGLKYISKGRRARIGRLARDLPKSNCDIIALQELFVGSDFEKIQEFMQRSHPHSVWFRAGVVGSGLAIFSSFPIVHSWYHPYRLSGKFRQWFHGDWFAAKGIAHARVLLDDNEHLDVITTHLIANYGKGTDEYLVQRYAQTFELSKYIDRLNSDAFILLGDFNYNTSHPAFKGVMENNLFTKFRFAQVPIGNTFNLPTSANHKPKEPEEAIDHIFYGSALNLKNSSLILEDGYSDHAGVSAVFTKENFTPRINLNKPDYHALHTMMTLLSEEIHALDKESTHIWRHFLFNSLLIITILSCLSNAALLSGCLLLIWSYQAFLFWVFIPQEQAALEQLWNEWSFY